MILEKHDSMNYYFEFIVLWHSNIHVHVFVKCYIVICTVLKRLWIKTMCEQYIFLVVL